MQKLLKDFLASPERPDDTMGYHKLCGFLFSIACSPELIKPSEWMPLIFSEQDPGYSSLDQAKDVTGAIFELYNKINEQVSERKVQLPDDCRITEEAADNFGGPLGQWSAGFVSGHSWLIESWDAYTPDELDEELGSCIMVLSYFADLKLAEAYRKKASNKDITADNMAQTVVELFSTAMINYARLGYSIYTVLSESRGQNQPYINDQKTGRNEPCPCGSGKKYKHCCLH